MVWLVALLAFNLCCWVCGTESPYLEPVYYWREYDNGQVPSDAIPGGRDKNGSITYIGGVIPPHGQGLISANLYPRLYAVAEYGDSGTDRLAHVHTKYLQILCSRRHECFRWVKTNVTGFDNVDGTIVRAGKELDWVLYIGRGVAAGELRVGKIIRTNIGDKGLRLPDDIEAGTHAILEDFEVLVFYPPCKRHWWH